MNKFISHIKHLLENKNQSKPAQTHPHTQHKSESHVHLRGQNPFQQSPEFYKSMFIPSFISNGETDDLARKIAPVKPVPIERNKTLPLWANLYPGSLKLLINNLSDLGYHISDHYGPGYSKSKDYKDHFIQAVCFVKRLEDEDPDPHHQWDYYRTIYWFYDTGKWLFCTSVNYSPDIMMAMRAVKGIYADLGKPCRLANYDWDKDVRK